MDKRTGKLNPKGPTVGKTGKTKEELEAIYKRITDSTLEALRNTPPEELE